MSPVLTPGSISSSTKQVKIYVGFLNDLAVCVATTEGEATHGAEKTKQEKGWKGAHVNTQGPFDLTVDLD